MAYHFFQGNGDKMSESEDNLLRDMLASCSSYVIPAIDDGDETYYKYWEDNGRKIRTCHECKISEFKCKFDGYWVLYFTKERLLWAFDHIEKQNCSLCKKFNERWKDKK